MLGASLFDQLPREVTEIVIDWLWACCLAQAKKEEEEEEEDMDVEEGLTLAPVLWTVQK